MLLRRITEHVQAQNWFAVLIDFVIVVVGVFIGIQVANWNEQRATDLKAKALTARLTEDPRKEAWGYESVIAYNRETNANQRRVLDYPCTPGIPNEKVRATANALKASPRFVPALQVRFADNQTDLNVLVQENREVLEGLRTITARKP